MRSHDDRGLEQVAAVLREDLARARLAHLVAGAADALQAARDRARRLDEHDEIDRAHVDAELEAARRDDAAQAAGLEVGLDLQALLARQRAVVRAHELFAGELVEVRREPLGGAARVAEHDRGAVREDQLEHARVHVRPDALVGLGRVEAERVGGRARRLRVRAGLGHVVDRDDHLDVELLARAGVDDGDRARRRRRSGRRGSARSRRAGAAWPRGRCVAAARRRSRRGARATARGARRAWWARARGSRRRSRSRRCAGSRAPAT